MAQIMRQWAPPWLAIALVVVGVLLWLLNDTNWQSSNRRFRLRVALMLTTVICAGVAMMLLRDEVPLLRPSLKASGEQHSEGAKVDGIYWHDGYTDYLLTVTADRADILSLTVTAVMPGLVVDCWPVAKIGVDYPNVSMAPGQWAETTEATYRSRSRTRSCLMTAARLPSQQSFSARIIVERSPGIVKEDPGHVIVERSHEYAGKKKPDDAEEYAIIMRSAGEELLDVAGRRIISHAAVQATIQPIRQIEIEDHATGSEQSSIVTPTPHSGGSQ